MTRKGTVGGIRNPFRLLGEHLLPSGELPGSKQSKTVWTGCDGPPRRSWADRRARIVGLFSWILVGFLTVWLHVTDLGGFTDSFPYVFGAKVLVFAWVLFGVSILRPLFIRRSTEPVSYSEGTR